MILAAKNTHKHLDNWTRTFKSVGSGIGKVTSAALRSVAPSISESYDTGVDAIRDTRMFIQETKTRVKEQKRVLDTTFMGKRAKDVLGDAISDIKNGTFSLNSYANDSYDSMDNFDNILDDIQIDETDPASVNIGESKRNTAILGKTIAEGNAATIAGISNATATMANVTVKATEAAVNGLSNIMITNMNQTTAQLAGVNSRLDMINANIVSILDYQRTSAHETNKAALDFYSTTANMINEMGKSISNLHDLFENKLSKTTKDRSNNSFNNSTGFSASEYRDYIKKNFKDKMAYLDMLKSMGGVATSLGQSPLDMALSLFAENLIPKKTRNSMKRFDKVFSNSMENVLYRVGDWKYDSSFMKNIIGTFFGKDRPSARIGVDLGNYKKDAMTWNGIAQKTLVEVIPSYLSKIEASLTKGEQRFYDSDKGVFKTLSELKKEYRDDQKNKIEFEMNGFVTEFNKVLDKAKLNNNDSDSIRKTINSAIDDRIRNGTNMDKTMQTIQSSMKGKLSDTDINNLLMEFNSSMHSLTSELQRSSQIQDTVYANLFNRNSRTKNFIRGNANIFGGNKFTDSGKLYSELSEEERKRMEADEEMMKKLKEGKKGAIDKVLGFFGIDRSKKKNKESFDSRISKRVDTIANEVFNRSYGFNNTDRAEAIIAPATSKHTESKKQKSKASASNSATISATASKMPKTFDSSIKMDPDKANREAIAVINESSAAIEDSIGTPNEAQVATTAAVQSLHSFLSSSMTNLFGAKGVLSKFVNDESLKKVKDKLFDEEKGTFRGVTKKVKDQKDHVRYLFNGKGYTDREGIKHEDDAENSVISKVLNKYDEVYQNAMGYLLDDKSGDPESYKKSKYFKYFKFLDLKSKREALFEKRKEAQKASETTNEAKINAVEEVKNKNKKARTRTIERAKAKQAKAEKIITDGAKEAADIIVEKAEESSEALFGNTEDPKSAEKMASQIASDANKMTKKSKLTSILGAAGIGGIVGASLKLHGTGLLGSFFLPGGPIGGALVGVGLHFLKKSKGFSEFAFGKEDENGNKTGGIISQKTQEFFKKNSKLIIGGAAVGALKGGLKSVLGLGTVGGPLGFVFNSLLPGGPIGGAVMATGLTLLKSNKTFQNIMFGKEGEDGKRIGGLINKNGGKLTKIMEKSGGFVKGALKGVGIGTLSSLAIGQMGILGGALTIGGPIGGAVAGLGIGIASQTEKFKRLMFGEMEFDEDGNPIGRMKNGLLTKLRNELVVNVFEPIKDTMTEKAAKFGYWLKNKIEYPFRLAFGPLVDQFKTIKKDIVDVVHDVFNNIGEKITGGIKKVFGFVFNPIKSLAKRIGTGSVSLLEKGAEFALTPVSMGLNMLAFGTSHLRRKQLKQENRTIKEHKNDIMENVRAMWAEEDAKGEYGRGIGGFINKTIAHKRIKNSAFEAAREGYESELQDVGGNTLNYLGVKRERKQLKAEQKAWKKKIAENKEINKERRALMKQFKSSEVRLSPEEIKRIQARFSKLGIEADSLSTNEDINNFLYERDRWMDTWGPRGRKEVEGAPAAEINANGVSAEKTEKYQDEVTTYLGDIRDMFAKLAAGEYFGKQKNMKTSQMVTIERHLREKGWTWEDISLDPSEIANLGDMSTDDITKYMKRVEKLREDKSTAGDASKIAYEEYIASKTDEKEQSATITETLATAVNDLKDAIASSPIMGNAKNSKTNTNEDSTEALLNTMESIQAATETSATLDANQAAVEMNATPSEINKTTNRRFSFKQLRLSNVRNRFLKKKARDERENAESEAARSGGTSLQESENEAEINGLKDQEVQEEAKEKTSGFFSNLFSKVGKFITNPKVLAAAGIGTVIAGFFSDTIKDFGKKAINGIGNWWNKNGQPLLDKAITGICNSMDWIVSSGLKIAGSLVSSVGKFAINKVAGIFGFTPFDDTETFETEEEAQKVAESRGLNAHGNQILSQNKYIDENGEVDTVGNRSMRSTLVREGIQFSRSSLNRKLLKGSAKVAGTGLKFGAKVATAPLKLLGGAGRLGVKIAGGIGKGIIGTAKLVRKGVSAGIDAIGRKAGKEGAEKAVKSGLKDVAKNKAKEVTKSKSFIKNFIKKVSGILKSVTDKVSKWIGETKFVKFIKNFCDELTEKIMKSDNKLIKKIAEKIAKKTGNASVRTAADATVIIGIAFAIYDSINGALNASYLFGVDDDDVTAGMRVVSSILEFLWGTAPGAWLDICLEVYGMITGKNPKQWIACKLYGFVAGEDAQNHINKSLDRMEAETAKYNKANGTNLTSKEYNELKNGNKDILGRAKQAWKKISPFTSKEEYDAMYNFDKYEVTDEELKQYQKSKKKSKVSYGIGQYKFSKTKSVGYGSYLQGDPRWANYPLGRFPDGSVSTMETAGCGPTALSMVANQLGKSPSPLTVAKYAQSNGYIADGGATSGLFTDGAKAMGLEANKISGSNIKKSLQNGNPVVVSGKGASGSSPYTEAGHVVMASGIDATGNAIVNDPMRGQRTVSINKLASGMTNGWSYSKSAGYGDPRPAVPIQSTPPISYSDTAGGASSAITVSPSSTQRKQVKVYSEDVSKLKLSNGENAEKYVDNGYQLSKNSGEKNFNTPSYYKGLVVNDLKLCCRVAPTLMNDPEIPLFGVVYNNYVTSNAYSDNFALDYKVIARIKQTSSLKKALAKLETGVGKDKYKLKNGFPFYDLTDSRWADIPWKNKTIKTHGSDIASLAMVSSAFGKNMFTPDYIYNNWLPKAPNWWSKKDGLYQDIVYSDGGFNAMKSTHVNGKRLKTERIKNISSIIAALKSRKPVVMTGYRFLGSPFGGTLDPVNVDQVDSNLSTIVATYGNDGVFAVNDPLTNLNDENNVFSTALLDQKLGSSQFNAIKEAYVVSKPNGKGISENGVNLNKKKGGVSDYTSIADAKGLTGKLGALLSNFVAIGQHAIDGLLGETNGYRSIMSINEIENDGVDKQGLNKSTSSSAMAEGEYEKKVVGMNGKTYTVRYQPNGYAYAVTNTNEITSTSNPTNTSYNYMKVHGRFDRESESDRIYKYTTQKYNGNNNNSVMAWGTSWEDPTLTESIGSGSRDFAIGYGKKKKKKKKEKNPSIPSTSTTPKASMDGFDVFEKISVVGAASQASMLGEDYTTAYNNAVATIREQKGEEVSSDSGTSGSSATLEAELSDDEYKSRIWSWLTSTAGLTKNAAAGIMGCWQSESHNNPTVVEGYYLKDIYPGFDKISDSAVLDEYTKALFQKYRAGGHSINEDAYKAEDGHYYPGFGLAQWTGPRAKKLKDYAQANNGDWRNLNSQLDFFYNADGEFSSRSGLKDKLNNTSTPEDAATIFLDHFEMSNPGWHNTETGSKQNSERRSNAKGIYKLYKDQTKESGGSHSGSYFGLGRFRSRSIGYGPVSKDWIGIVKAVKSAIAAQQVGYSQSNYITITVSGESLKVRTDCSGFVSACCYFYGANIGMVDSRAFTGSLSALTSTGFTRMSFPGWDNLLPGDIMAKNGHVEIYAGKINGQHKSWNCGSTESCNNPNPTSSTNQSTGYTTVWRLPNAGTGNANYTYSQDFTSTDTTSTRSMGTSSGILLSILPIGSMFKSLSSSFQNPFNILGYGKGSSGNTPASWFSKTLNGRVTSGYGSRRSLLGNEVHRGIDIGAMSGQDIYSPIDGTIVDAGTDVAGYGNYAVVQDEAGLNHLFAHMNKPVGYGVGAKIHKSDIIGEIGSSGKSTGSHLHYEIRKNGNKYSTINPETYDYDKSVSKNLNIRSDVNNIGGGSRDLATDSVNKLDVALNTSSMETKLDSLIEVMKNWAAREAEKRNASQNINQVNNTTTISYGNGKKETKTTSKKVKNVKDLSSQSLLNIHNAIASI